MSNIISTLMYFTATSGIILVTVFIFNLINKNQAWNEMKNGNMAAAFSIGGIILGISNIMHAAIMSNDSLAKTIKWGGAGAIGLIIVYILFELLTPKLNVREEIKKGNKAVGFICLSFSLAFSYIIAASIS